ncbi:MAG: hypothetical protein OCD01_14065 [Fibrobacterales bacterium]
MIEFKGVFTLLAVAGCIATSAIAAPDVMGVENVPKKDTIQSESLAWFKLGDMRLINNDWGSINPETNCSTSDFEIFVKENGSFGWNFDREGCGASGTKPDYPELEFGIHPFGVNKGLVTTPDYTSTDLLPIQIKDIDNMSIDIDNYRIDLGKGGSWNLNFEMWLTDQHPIDGQHTNAYAELMIFWGWYENRWECNVGNDMMHLGDRSYRLCHQSDEWGGWRYYQFRNGNGGNDSRGYDFTGNLDVKEALKWLVDNAGFSEDLWVARLELGTEIDDGTSGTVTFDDVTFNVNGESRGVEFFDPTAVVSSSSEPELSSETVSSSSEVVSSSSIESSEAAESSTETSSDDEDGENSSDTESSGDSDGESSETSALFNNSNSTNGTSLMYRVYPTQSATAIKVKEDGRYSVSLFDALGNMVTQFEAQSESKSIMLHSSKETAEGLYIMKAVKIQ